MRSLPEISSGIGHLPQEQQGDDDGCSEFGHVLKRIANAGPIKAPVGLEAAFAAATGAQEMIMIGAAPISEVQPTKGIQRQSVAVVNARFRSMRHQEAAL